MMVARQRGPQGHRVHRSVDATRTAPRPGSPPPTGPGPARCWPIPMLPPRTSPVPGHVFPLRYHPGGVLRRPGHTEASVDLARLAGRRPAAVICEVVNPDGTMARVDDLEVFCDEHGLLLVTIADLIAYRRDRATPGRTGRDGPSCRPLRRVDGDRLPLGDRRPGVAGAAVRRPGRRTARTYWCGCTPSASPVTSSGRLRCDCGAQLDLAMARIAEEGRGVIVYLRGHEGRGIGLLHKLQAYELQDGRCRHRRREPRARAARRRARLRHRCDDPGRPRPVDPAAADQQPGEACGAARLRALDRRPGPVEVLPNAANEATCAPRSSGWATSSPATTWSSPPASATSPSSWRPHRRGGQAVRGGAMAPSALR
jgi:hypothetical protein